MENIEKIKKKYKKFFSESYYNKQEEELTEFESYECSLLSELWAYVYSIVPEEHGDYTIFDFDGYIVNKSDKSRISALSPDIALAAKDSICKYCWNMSWEDIQEKYSNEGDNITAFLRKRSVMNLRHRKGNNIVIYGASSKPIGRTMLASIVMKEAIRLRVTHHVRGQTYDWIDFPKLLDAIDKDNMELADYRSCDWLVVDNIDKKIRGAKQITYLVDRIDPFFIDRYRNKQPTILVFKFDLRDKSLDLEKTFGLGISRILSSKRTCKISLSENFWK